MALRGAGGVTHVLQAVALGDDDDAVFGDGQAAATVEIQVEANLHAGGDFHPFIDDGSADTGVASDIDAVKENRIGNVGETINPHARAEDAALDKAAGDN